MNVSLRTIAIGLCVFGLAACAGTQERTTQASPGVVGSYPVDRGYVSNIERMARAQGIEVTWVNVPVKRLKGQEEQL